jgi:hypothetical protein
MDAKTKFVLINVCLVVGLAFELYRGAPIFAVIITAVILFPLANVLMARKRKTESRF